MYTRILSGVRKLQRVKKSKSKIYILIYPPSLDSS